MYIYLRNVIDFLNTARYIQGVRNFPICFLIDKSQLITRQALPKLFRNISACIPNTVIVTASCTGFLQTRYVYFSKLSETFLRSGTKASHGNTRKAVVAQAGVMRFDSWQTQRADLLWGPLRLSYTVCISGLFIGIKAAGL